MIELIDYIKEGLKITSKTKVEKGGGVKTITDFSKKYDCEFISMSSCHSSKKVSEALEYVLSMDTVQFAKLEKDIRQELQHCEYDKKKYEFGITRNTVQRILSIIGKSDHVGLCGEIYVKPQIHKYTITLDIYNEYKEMQPILFHLLEYIIQYHEDIKK